jgi:hypothetical protein
LLDLVDKIIVTRYSPHMQEISSKAKERIHMHNFGTPYTAKSHRNLLCVCMYINLELDVLSGEICSTGFRKKTRKDLLWAL